MIFVIRQLHDGMRACVRLDGRVYSEGFAVEHGLRRVCVLTPLLFHILFTAVIYVVCTCFKAVKDIMDALVHMRKHKGAGERGKAVRYSLTNAITTSFCDVQYSHRRDLEAS